jgi:hypothetical protein
MLERTGMDKNSSFLQGFKDYGCKKVHNVEHRAYKNRENPALVS